MKTSDPTLMYLDPNGDPRPVKIVRDLPDIQPVSNAPEFIREPVTFSCTVEMSENFRKEMDAYMDELDRQALESYDLVLAALHACLVGNAADCETCPLYPVKDCRPKLLHFCENVIKNHKELVAYLIADRKKRKEAK